MKDGELTYDDFLQRLNIQTVLQDMGYILNRKDGLRYPSYVRIDSDGRRIRGDKFIVAGHGNCCFQPPEQKLYNVISLIKEHPQMFSDYRPGMSLDHLVNLVCNRLLCQPLSERQQRILDPKRDVKPFNLSNYQLHEFKHNDKDSQRPFYPFFKPRGFDYDTQYTFRNHFFLATKMRQDGLSFSNLSFPLTKPNDDKIVGFEERGRTRKDGTSYKGKAEGSNSGESLWIANLSGKPLNKVDSINWFESAYDALAYYQLHRNPDLKKGVFVSTGGTPTERQIRGLLEATPHARHYLGFDKDAAGKQFVEHVKQIAEELGFPKFHVISNHPLGRYKDYNDALLGKKDPTLSDEVDYDYHASEEEVKETEVHSRPLFRR